MSYRYSASARLRASFQSRARALVVALLLPLLAACGGATVSPTPPSSQSSATLVVSPAAAKVAVGGAAQQFSVTISGAANAGVTWEVNGVPGGSATLGTISSSGLYVSPAVMPSSGAVTVTAVSVADPAQFAGASLTLAAAGSSGALAVTPGAAAVQAGVGSLTFVATVSNSSPASVSWQVNGVVGGNSTVGTISSAGVYTPPATPPAQPTVTVTAVAVADPTQSASANVTVTSAAPSKGSATVSWTPPTQRTDGTPFTNLAGYHIYYGTAPGSYPHTVDVPSPGLTSYDVTGLPGGATYYFVTTAYDTSGVESDYSNVASKAIL